MELYTYAGNPRAMMALIAAEYNGVNINVPEFAMGTENKTPEFLAMNPNGKVPTLKTPQGPIFESTAIARYVARLRADTELMGASFYEQALVDQWIDWCTTEVVPTFMNWFGTVVGFLPPNPKTLKTAQEDLKKPLKILDDHFVNHTYLVGNKITLADIVIACYLLNGFKFLFDQSYRAPYPSLVRWFTTCVNQPQFLAVMGPVEFCETSMAIPAKPKAEKPKKEEKPKAEKKEEKKEEPKAEEPKPEAEKPKKKGGPFDDLPPSPFNLDTWLRIYSNTKTDFYSVMDQFWPMFDKEGWSIWFCDYRYNDECTIGFKTCNLVSGFIQRCDELRKYGFGNMNILKNEGDKHYTIRGCWLMRGQSADYMLEINPDAECYTWTKVENFTDEEKKLIADMWCSSDKIDGVDISSNEVFK